jgi:hypothetical protein
MKIDVSDDYVVVAKDQRTGLKVTLHYPMPEQGLSPRELEEKRTAAVDAVKLLGSRAYPYAVPIQYRS